MTVDFTLCRQYGTKTSVITGTTSSLLLSNEPTRDGANEYFKLITQMIQIRLDPASVSMRRSVKCRFLDWLNDSRHVENARPVQHIEIDLYISGVAMHGVDSGGHVHPTFARGRSWNWYKSDRFLQGRGRGSAASVAHPEAKRFSTSGGLRPPDPLTRGSAPGSRWGLRLQTPVIGSRYALAMSVHPTYFDLATPLIYSRLPARKHLLPKHMAPMLLANHIGHTAWSCRDGGAVGGTDGPPWHCLVGTVHWMRRLLLLLLPLPSADCTLFWCGLSRRIEAPHVASPLRQLQDSRLYYTTAVQRMKAGVGITFETTSYSLSSCW